jgi:O-antigen/teichoic acid export membrane protein
MPDTYSQLTGIRYIAGNVLTLLIGTLATQALTTVALLITARYLGVTGYGQYAATYALLAQTGVLLNFGLDTWLLRQGATSEMAIPKGLGNAAAIKLLLSLLWYPLVVMFAPLINPHVYPSTLVRAAALGVVCQAAGLSAQSAFKAGLRNEITALLQVVGATFFCVASLLLASQDATVVQFAWGRTVAFALVGLFGLYLAAQSFGLSPRFADLRGVGRKSFPFLLSEALAVVYASIDLTIVAIMLGESASGFYAPAITVVNALFIMPNAVYTVMVPVITRAYTRVGGQIRYLSMGLILGMGVLGLAMSLTVFVLASPIIAFLYDVAFNASADVLTILSAVLFFKPISYALAAILTAIDRQQDRVIVQAIVAFTNVAANLAIVQRYGVLGVASVYVLTEALLCLGYAIFMFKGSRGFTFAYPRDKPPFL